MPGVQLLHQTAAVQNCGDIRLSCLDGGVWQGDAQAHQVLLLLLGGAQRHRRGDIGADRPEGLADFIVDPQLFQVHLLGAAAVGGSHQLALLVGVAKALGRKPCRTGLREGKADILLGALGHHRVLDAVDVNAVDAVAQPLGHRLQSGGAALCRLAAVGAVVADAHDDLRLFGVDRHAGALGVQQLGQRLLHLGSVHLHHPRHTHHAGGGACLLRNLEQVAEEQADLLLRVGGHHHDVKALPRSLKARQRRLMAGEHPCALRQQGKLLRLLLRELLALDQVLAAPSFGSSSRWQTCATAWMQAASCCRLPESGQRISASGCAHSAQRLAKAAGVPNRKRLRPDSPEPAFPFPYEGDASSPDGLVGIGPNYINFQYIHLNLQLRSFLGGRRIPKKMIIQMPCCCKR